jgi:predicted metal-dependent enzyme (double-stranded beta helix superfamily)
MMHAAAGLAEAVSWPAIPAGLADPLEEARALIEAILADPASIAGLPLVRTPGRYERNFLFGDSTRSVWAMVWAPGSATPIHDHHCSCCFGMLAGELVERRFRGSDGLAMQTVERVRRPGFVACMQPSGPNIHQMLNASAVEAISIHVYGYDRTRQSSSILRQYAASGSAGAAPAG